MFVFGILARWISRPSLLVYRDSGLFNLNSDRGSGRFSVANISDILWFFWFFKVFWVADIFENVKVFQVQVPIFLIFSWVFQVPSTGSEIFSSFSSLQFCLQIFFDIFPDLSDKFLSWHLGQHWFVSLLKAYRTPFIRIRIFRFKFDPNLKRIQLIFFKILFL